MNLPVPREVVSRLPRYVPGARGGDGPTPVKLSSNENPYPPLDSVREVIARAAASVNRYPDMFSRDLTEALAHRYGLPEGAVVAGAGSVSVLGHALQAFCEPTDEVVYAWRSFEAYPILTKLTGATAVEVALAEDGRHDLAAMSEAVNERTKVILLCSPNNPTGPAIREDEFEAFMREVPSGVLVILDEAYVEFVRDSTVVDGREALTRFPNLLVARTFSKAYGLAGLRVGFALGDPEVVSAIRPCVTPFSLSGIAQSAALASLEAEGELFVRVDAIVGERDRTLEALRTQGWTPPETQSNFFWLGAKKEASSLANHLRAANPPILVRPFDGEGVRINIGSMEENDLLIAALGEYPSRF